MLFDGNFFKEQGFEEYGRLQTGDKIKGRAFAVSFQCDTIKKEKMDMTGLLLK